MINKKVNGQLILSIVLTIFLPVGIFLIIFGATHSGILRSILLPLGIVMTVFGFYGSPLSWVSFGENKVKQQIYNQIVLENVQDISILANNFNKKFEQMLEIVKVMITKRYLTGFEIVDNKYIIKKTNGELTQEQIWEQKGEVYSGICSGCGAPFEMVGNKKTYCKYCGKRILK